MRGFLRDGMLQKISDPGSAPPGACNDTASEQTGEARLPVKGCIAIVQESNSVLLALHMEGAC